MISIPSKLERFKLLITVKTYPLPSFTYDELVCTAGVTEQGDFLRLYPINFRDLPFSQQFKKYQWIEVTASKHRTNHDRRKESYRPDNDSIRLIGEPIRSNPGNWEERAKYALKQKSRSLEELSDKLEFDQTSLGVFKPKEVYDLVISDDDPEWRPSQQRAFLQFRLWETRTASKEPPRKVPFKFHFKFLCNDNRCKGKHRISIHDWEAGALFWRLVDSGHSHKQASEMVREKFLLELCGPDKDTHFFVGTVFAHPKNWIILGIFYPKINSSKPESSQLSLFDS